ncbi:hypothetical protein RclHR1_03140015 [Rhizophagus clarus]|uniref:F-box domain-containing protein n=1 Tax=Rhizophagus clarus TaxID=94130 RepID=A0A2Z6S198_9GLOM|nr:hypothetical protein RclHR1_03140015 [Rhizophagus clarus]GES99213.1 hypothetical protein GLOIN_2v1789114 [Rhizophagus clarus]
MSLLSKDILFLIFKELNNDKKSLCSCLLVNRAWCVTAVPILWRNPAQYLTNNNKTRNALCKIIFLHLPEESKDILKNLGINLIIGKYQHLLFNYINFWRYFDLSFIENLITQITKIKTEESKKFINSNLPIIRKEILKLFINRNSRFLHLSIPSYYNDCQLQRIPEAESCFSGLESFQCCASTDQNNLDELTRMCKSIKKLKFTVNADSEDNYAIIKLIKAQKNLTEVQLLNYKRCSNEIYEKYLEESFIKHANTIKHLKILKLPITRYISHLVNLLTLEINTIEYMSFDDSYLDNVSLPVLRILKAQLVTCKILAGLIENTKGHLTEISLLFIDFNTIRLTQAIHNNCPNLKFLRLALFYTIDSSFEYKNLFTKCQFLEGLIIDAHNSFFDWDKLFEVLSESTSVNLFKFKFFSTAVIKPTDIKPFFDNWKNKKPMLLKVRCKSDPDALDMMQQLEDLIEKHKAEGIIERYFIGPINCNDDNFEWF